MPACTTARRPLLGQPARALRALGPCLSLPPAPTKPCALLQRGCGSGQIVSCPDQLVSCPGFRCWPVCVPRASGTLWPQSVQAGCGPGALQAGVCSGFLALLLLGSRPGLSGFLLLPRSLWVSPAPRPLYRPLLGAGWPWPLSACLSCPCWHLGHSQGEPHGQLQGGFGLLWLSVPSDQPCLAWRLLRRYRSPSVGLGDRSRVCAR